jgi:hypothetical protein
MNPSPLDSLAGIILSLQAEGSVPYSRLSASVMRQAQSLFHTGALVVEPKGGGRSVVIKNSVALSGYISSNYPNGLWATDIDGEGNRTRGVRLHGDSKKTGNMDMEVVVFRADYPSPPFLTGQHEGFTLGSFILSERVGASFSGRVATVENHEFFATYHWEAAGFHVALLASGRASNRFISWLASDSMKDAQYTHFGDYDPVGLDEFARMYDKLGDRIKLYIPDNLEVVFKSYRNKKLVTDSGKLLFRLSTIHHPDIDRVIWLIREYGGGVEQEVLLMDR